MALCTSSCATSSPMADAACTRTGSSGSMMQSITPRSAISSDSFVVHLSPAWSKVCTAAHARRRKKGSGLLSAGRTCCTKKASSLSLTPSWLTIVELIEIHIFSAPSNWRAVACSG